MKKLHPAKDPERNVWMQLGLADAEEHFLKAELVLRLSKTLKARGFTQLAAARKADISQPELSKILNGKFSEVSLERLMHILASLGNDIEIKIRATAQKSGEITVIDARSRAA